MQKSITTTTITSADDNNDFLKDWTCEYTTKTLVYELKIDLGKEDNPNITLDEALRSLRPLLLEIKAKYPNFYRYCSKIIAGLYSSNSVQMAFEHNIDFIFKDIRTNETELQLAYNCCLYYMLVTLSNTLRVKEEAKIVDVIDIPSIPLLNLFDIYQEVLGLAFPNLSKSLFDLFSFFYQNDYFLEWLNFSSMLFKLKMSKLFKTISLCINKSQFNLEDIKGIKDPTDLNSLGVFCQELLILFQINNDTSISNSKASSFNINSKQIKSNQDFNKSLEMTMSNIHHPNIEESKEQNENCEKQEKVLGIHKEIEKQNGDSILTEIQLVQNLIAKKRRKK